MRVCFWRGRLCAGSLHHTTLATVFPTRPPPAPCRPGRSQGAPALPLFTLRVLCCGACSARPPNCLRNLLPASFAAQAVVVAVDPVHAPMEDVPPPAADAPEGKGAA